MAQALVGDGNAKRDPVVEPSKPRLLSVLGPGLITDATDDDPSGIATYSRTGALFVQVPIYQQKRLRWTQKDLGNAHSFPAFETCYYRSLKRRHHYGRENTGNFIP